MLLRTAVTAPVTVLLTALVLVGAAQSPVGAQPLAVPDEAGDAIGRGIDLTSVKFRNRDHAVVVRLVPGGRELRRAARLGAGRTPPERWRHRLGAERPNGDIALTEPIPRG